MKLLTFSQEIFVPIMIKCKNHKVSAGDQTRTQFNSSVSQNAVSMTHHRLLSDASRMSAREGNSESNKNKSQVNNVLSMEDNSTWKLCCSRKSSARCAKQTERESCVCFDFFFMCRCCFSCLLGQQWKRKEKTFQFSTFGRKDESTRKRETVEWKENLKSFSLSLPSTRTFTFSCFMFIYSLSEFTLYNRAWHSLFTRFALPK